MEFNFRNVNDAFAQLVGQVQLGARTPDGPFAGEIPVSRRPSRYGDTLTIEEPVTITYGHPVERVLFNKARDANCFFHLYEVLWMLAGRRDVAPLAFYNSRMTEFSDDGKTQNGAYGYRWRHARHGVGTKGNVWYGGTIKDRREEVDQLDFIVDHLKANPTSRRAVLQMWNVEDDLLKVGYAYCPKCKGSSTCDTCDGSGVLDMGSKDVCCNLSAMFSLRERRISAQGVGVPDKTVTYLDITVINRSNDMVWGLLGANYVQFTVLLEYMAARLGAEVGVYRHFTNNLHVYTATWDPGKWVSEYEPSDNSSRWYGQVAVGRYRPIPGGDGRAEWVDERRIKTMVPLVRDPEEFERELLIVVEHFGGGVRQPNPAILTLTEPFLRKVAAPMFRAYELHRTYRETDQALRACDLIEADDWRMAARNWLVKRYKKEVAT